MVSSKQAKSDANVLRYGITGASTAAVYVAAGAILHYLFELTVTWATSLAFALSVVFNYLLHYYFTFEADDNHWAVIPRFMVMITGGGMINWGISEFGYALIHSLPAIQLASIIMIVLWNFVLSYLWVFKK